MNSTEPCVCCSGRSFGTCCKPFLDGSKLPRTVKQLMRSRYAAYALGGHADYLKKTWHPACAAALDMADLDAGNRVWLGLEILGFEQRGDVGQVEFRARYRDDEGQEKIHHERSAFARQEGQWLFLSGEVSDGPA